jgi:hypothetical protein
MIIICDPTADICDECVGRHADIIAGARTSSVVEPIEYLTARPFHSRISTRTRPERRALSGRVER